MIRATHDDAVPRRRFLPRGPRGLEQGAAEDSRMQRQNTLLKEKIFWPWFTLIGTLVTITVALFLAPLFPSSTEMDRSSGKREAPAAPASVP